MSTDKPTLLKVKFPYKPVNNDELRLEKGDIITLTQKEEGGWWEGTLNGRTGWFPSNYVVEIPADSKLPVTTATVQSSSPSTSIYASPVKSGNNSQVDSSSPVKRLVQHESTSSACSNSSNTSQSASSNLGSRSTITTEEQIQYRRMILSDLIESESAHVADLQKLWETILQQLPKAGILTTLEYKVLVGNLTEIIQVLTACLLTPIKAEQSKPAKEQRIGKIFLDSAPKIESVHKSYCSNHPKAIQIIEKFKEQLDIFVDNKRRSGSPGPGGILHLIAVLSQPFRRLEKYPTFLLELERNVEEFHKDRGDIQRSIEYYKQLDKTCTDLRKQKEMELEVMKGSIIGWEGSDIALLGEIIHMNLVHIGPEKEPRYFVLFTNTLLILSYDLEKSSLTYEGKIPVSGITLTQHGGNHFEIAGPMIDPIVVSCPTRQAKEAWINHINKILKANRFPSVGNSPQQTFGQLTPPIQAWSISRLRPAPPFNPFLNECLTWEAKNASSNGKVKGKHPSSSPSSNNSISSYPQLTHEEDFTLLQIIDSFCAKNRQTSCASLQPSSTSSSPGKYVNGNPIKRKIPRTLAEHVHSLHDEVAGLKSNVLSLKSQLTEEQNARKSLQSMVHSLMVIKSNGKSSSGSSVVHVHSNNASASSSSVINQSAGVEMPGSISAVTAAE